MLRTNMSTPSYCGAYIVSLMGLAARFLEAMEECTPPMTKAALARAAVVKKATVTSWLDGTTKTLSGDVLLRAARALNVTPQWLQTGHLPKRPAPKTEELTSTQREILDAMSRVTFQDFLEVMADLKRRAIKDDGQGGPEE